MGESASLSTVRLFFLPPVECLDPLDMPAEALCVSGKCEMRDCEIKNSFKLASVELTEDLRIRRHARQRIFSSGYFDNAFPFGTRVINSDMIHQVEIEIAEIPLCFEAKIAQCFCKRPSSLYGLFLKTPFISQIILYLILLTFFRATQCFYFLQRTCM